MPATPASRCVHLKASVLPGGLLLTERPRRSGATTSWQTAAKLSAYLGYAWPLVRGTSSCFTNSKSVVRWPATCRVAAPIARAELLAHWQPRCRSISATLGPRCAAQLVLHLLEVCCPAPATCRVAAPIALDDLVANGTRVVGLSRLRLAQGVRHQFVLHQLEVCRPAPATYRAATPVGRDDLVAYWQPSCRSISATLGPRCDAPVRASPTRSLSSGGRLLAEWQHLSRAPSFWRTGSRDVGLSRLRLAQGVRHSSCCTYSKATVRHLLLAEWPHLSRSTTSWRTAPELSVYLGYAWPKVCGTSSYFTNSKSAVRCRLLTERLRLLGATSSWRIGSRAVGLSRLRLAQGVRHQFVLHQLEVCRPVADYLPSGYACWARRPRGERHRAVGLSRLRLAQGVRHQLVLHRREDCRPTPATCRVDAPIARDELPAHWQPSCRSIPPALGPRCAASLLSGSLLLAKQSRWSCATSSGALTAELSVYPDYAWPKVCRTSSCCTNSKFAARRPAACRAVTPVVPARPHHGSHARALGAEPAGGQARLPVTPAPPLDGDARHNDH